MKPLFTLTTIRKSLLPFLAVLVISVPAFPASFDLGFVPSRGLAEGEKVFTDSTIGMRFLGNNAKAVGAGVASPPLWRLYRNGAPFLGFVTFEVHGLGEVGPDKQFSDTAHSTIGTTVVQYRNLRAGIHYKYTDSQGDFEDNLAIAISGSITGAVEWVQELFTGELF